MAVNYKTRRSAPLKTNGYTTVVNFLKKQEGIDVIEGSEIRKEVIADDAPKKWNHCTHAQIHSGTNHIGDIIALDNHTLVVYDSFPQQVLDGIIDLGYLTRELTTPPEKGPIETDFGFK